MQLNENQVENPLMNEEKNTDSDVRMVSFEAFKDTILDFILTLDDDQKISIAINDKLLKKLNADEFYQKAADLIDLTNEDELKLPLSKTKSTLDYTEALQQYSNEMKLLLDSYHHLNSKKYNNKSLAELVNAYVICPTPESSLNFSQWFISVDDYTNKLSLIQKAAQIFEKIPLHDWYGSEINAINDANDRSSTIAYLEVAIQDFRKCKTEIASELNKIGKKWKKHAYEKFNALYNTYFELNQNIILFCNDTKQFVPKKPSLLNFNKTDKIRFDKFEQLKKESIALSQKHKEFFDTAQMTSPINSLSDINELLIDVNKDLSLWPYSINNDLSEKMGRISTLNTSNETLKEAALIIDAYLIEMNSKKIWTKKMELNSNIYVNYLTFIDGLLDQCAKVIEAYEKEDNRQEWSLFMNNLPSKDQVFLKKFLTINPSRWVKEFEAYYNIKLIHALHHPLTVQNQQRSKSIYAQYQIFKSVKSEKASNRLIDLFSHRFALLNKQNPKLIKQFAKEKTSHSKHDFYKEDIAMVTNLFPITIKTIKDEDTNASMHIIQDGIIKSIYFSVLTDEPVEQLKFINSKMNDTPMTERFSVASNLAKSLLYYVETFSILQLKNANIICLWPESLSKILAQRLDKYGVKLFSVKSREEDALIESIIESNRNQMLLTMNGLPNYELPEELIDQYKVMEAFINVGFNIINIWTVDLLDNADRVFEALEEKLTSVC